MQIDCYLQVNGPQMSKNAFLFEVALTVRLLYEHEDMNFENESELIMFTTFPKEFPHIHCMCPALLLQTPLTKILTWISSKYRVSTLHGFNIIQSI